MATVTLEQKLKLNVVRMLKKNERKKEREEKKHIVNASNFGGVPNFGGSNKMRFINILHSFF